MGMMKRIYEEAQYQLESEGDEQPTQEQIIERGQKIIVELNQWFDQDKLTA